MCSSGSEPQQAVVSWCLQERNVFGWWYRQQDSRQEKNAKLFSFSGDQSLYTPVKLHQVQKNNGFLGGKTTANSPMMVLFIDCEIVYACHTSIMCTFWGWLKTCKLECSNRVLKRKPPGNTLHANVRHTEDGRRGLRRQRGRGGRLRESIPTEKPRRFHYLEYGDLQKKISRLKKM